MFFILSKILSFLTTPGFWVFILLVLALWKPHKRKKFLWWAFGVFYFFSNGMIINMCLRWWDWQKETLPPQTEIAVVLGGYSSFNFETNQVEFNGSADRVMIPLQWYFNGNIKKIFLSGGSGELLKQTYSPQLKVAELLVRSGVKASDIIVEPKSRNTRENALFVANYVDSLNLDKSKMVLVTSAMHMRRSMGCFEKVGLNLSPYPVDYNSTSIWDKASFSSIFIPDMSALAGWNSLTHEWIGYISYKLMGYV